jgi:hypothetical protein
VHVPRSIRLVGLFANAQARDDFQFTKRGVRHYLTQAGSKAKSNGGMLKAGSDIDLSDETILKPGKSDQNSASGQKSDENEKSEAP